MKTSTLNTLFAALVIVLLAGCNNSRIERPDGDFQVEAIAPADGAEAVPADQSIRIRFNVAPAAGAVDATTITVTADDEPVTGKLLVDGNQVTFVPAQLRPHTGYRVTVSGALLGANGGALGSDHVSTFETARLRRGQPDKFVDADAQAPFKNQKFVYLTRQTEMVLLGFNYDGRGHNFYVVDPGDATAPDTIMHSEAAPRFSQDIRKVAAAGNLDRDAHDEVVMVLQENETAGKIHVLDGTNGDFDIRELEYTLSIPDTDGGAYRYELALGDVDGDGYDEIIVAAHHDSRTAYLWVIDDMRSGYTLLTEKVIPAGPAGAIDDLQLAVGDLDGDGSAEIAVANTWWSQESYIGDFTDYGWSGSIPGAILMMNEWRYEISLLVIEELDEELSDKTQPVRRSGHEHYGWMYDVFAQTPFSLFPGLPAYQTTPRVVSELRTGDLDGDGRAELLLTSRAADFTNRTELFGGPSDALAFMIETCADASELSVERLVDGELVTAATTRHNKAVDCLDDYDSTVWSVALDTDGDRKDEVLFNGQMHKWNGTDLTATGNLVDLSSEQTAVLSVTRGDSNGDGLTDVLVLRDNGSVSVYGNGRVKTHYDLDMQPQFSYSWSNLDTLRNDNTTRIGDSQVLVAANLDDDSLILEPRRINEAHADQRTVEHTTVFSADRIVAVLAAAPCHAETWQDSRRCRTALSRPDDNQMTGDASLIVTSGTMVSSEVSDASAFGLKEAAYQLSGYLADELTRNGRGRQSATTEARFDTAATAKDDLVVFYTVPYHRYTFTFASHPDPAVRGTRAYINLPLAPRVFSMTRTAYNVTHTGAGNTSAASNAKLNDTLFPHVAGEPSTYLTADEAEELSVNTSETQSVRKDRHAARRSLGLWRQATADGIISLDAAGSSRLSCEGLRVGFSTTTPTTSDAPVPAATASFSSDLDAQGSVGALHESTWEDNHYNWGLFSYLATQSNASDAPTQQFLIISYYVD